MIEINKVGLHYAHQSFICKRSATLKGNYNFELSITKFADLLDASVSPLFGVAASSASLDTSIIVLSSKLFDFPSFNEG